MLRRENQRMFQELAVAREAGAEDRKRCEKLQATVDRLDMDVERLTAENFRLKFAADTGYEVTGDDLLAAMEDGDVHFQSLPSPGKDNTSRESQDFVPSPILEAQSQHESKLLAMKAETSSMRKLQELLTNAHAENRKLKAEQQQQRRESSSDLQEEMSKVMTELVGMRSEGERMHNENMELRQEVKSKARELEGLLQRYKDLEAVLDKTLADNRELRQRSELADLIKSQKQRENCETEVKVDAKDSSLGKEYNFESASLPTGAHSEVDTSAKKMTGSNDVHLERSDYVTHTLSKREVKHTGSSSSSVFAKSDDEREGSYESRRVGVGDRGRTARDDIMARSSMQGDKALNSDHGSAKSGGAMELPLSRNLGSDKALDRIGDVEDPVSRTANESSPEAVVDWKYLAMTPEPENEMRSIAQYLSSNRDTGTASEVESEAESRASDLFTSSTVSSPVGKFKVAHERRPSLGGLIVERSQESPPMAQHQEEKDETAIDESYLETSHDYLTADENSLSRTASPAKLDFSPNAPPPSEETYNKNNSTPYYTPMVQRNKHNFSSVTTSLKSLKDISRKAREEIESEPVNGVPEARNEATRSVPYMSTYEQERKLIQEELGKIRLDHNIPGERYPDIGVGKDSDGGFESRIYTSPTGRYVPRWRKFQFKSKRTSPEAVQHSSHISSDPYLQRYNIPGHRTTSPTRLERVSVGHSTAGTFRSSSSNVGSRIYPTMSALPYTVLSSQSSSDDLLDEYTPLPEELREPRRLAELTPVKSPPHAAFTHKTRHIQGSRSPNAQAPRTNGAHAINSLSRQDIPSTQGWKFEVPLTNFGVARLSPNSGNPYRTDIHAGPNSPTGTDDICASDSVSMIGASGSVKSHSKQVTFEEPHRTAVAPVPLERKSLLTSQSISQRTEHRVESSESPKATVPVPAERKSLHANPSHSKPASSCVDRNGGSGGMPHSQNTLTPEDLDALAERVIQEADSGVSLTSSVEPKNGLSTESYQHALLSPDQQTYANSLIAKYVQQNMPQKC